MREGPKPIAPNSAVATLACASEPSPVLVGLPLREARDAFERVYFEQLLAQEGATIAHLVETSGLERTHLYRKLKSLGMTTGRKRRP